MLLIDRNIWTGELITEESQEASREDWKNIFTPPGGWCFTAFLLGLAIFIFIMV